MRAILLSATTAILSLSALGQAPVISEFTAVGGGLTKDFQNEPHDWLELHNPAATPVSLEGYFLTDNAAKLNKWRLPALTLEPGASRLLFASGKDLRDPAAELHTNFRLHPLGEYLALVAADGQTVVHEFGPIYPPQRVATYGLASGDRAKPGFLTAGSPGQANVDTVTPFGPLILDSRHAPEKPTANDDLVITARLQPSGAAIQSATIAWRVMYLPETSQPMLDDGRAPDEKAGDGVYSARIPREGLAGPNYQAGQMVRWRITAADATSNQTSMPGFHAPKDSPQYFGTVIQNPIDTKLPVLQTFLETPNSANNATGTRCALYYLGEFYDNCFIRIRGDTARGWPKRSYKIEFNDGHHFTFREDLPRVDEFNLNSTYTDKSYVRAVLAYELQRDSGTPSPIQQHVRVQRNGEFFSVALMVEQPDGDFLEREGLDRDGSLYKAVGGANFTTASNFEKKSRRWETRADLTAFNNGLKLTGDALAAFLFDNVDLPAQINFMACNIITQNIDASNKNYYAYRDTNGTGEWQMTPWDIDLTFGPDALNTDIILADEVTKGASNPNTPHPFLGGRQFQLHADKFNALLDQMIKNAVTREMLLRRTRTLLDQYLLSSYFERRIDQLVPYLEPDVLLDKAKWKTQNHFGGKTYTLQQATDRIKNEYLARRRVFLDNGGKVDMPKAQPSGARITIESVDFSPSSGNQDEEYIKLANPHEYAIDLSGWRVTGGIEYTFKPGTVIPKRGTTTPSGFLYLVKSTQAFRARKDSVSGGQQLFLLGGYDNHLSNFGETIRLLNERGEEVYVHTYEGQPSPLQKNLVITEVMYQPKENAQAEFIELWNRGEEPLDVSGARFSQGIEFDFANATIQILAPGARLLLVKNRAAFAAVYDAGLPIAGEFANGSALANEGERVKIEDRANNTILDFRYNNKSPWPVGAAGGGTSLVWRHGDPAHPANWRASDGTGSPNKEDRQRFGAGDAAADLDQDGRSAFAEYALGSSDSTPDTRAALSVGADDQGRVRLAFTRHGLADDARFTLEASSDLRTWRALTEDEAELEDTTAEPNGQQRLSYRVKSLAARSPRLFARLVIGQVN